MLMFKVQTHSWADLSDTGSAAQHHG